MMSKKQQAFLFYKFVYFMSVGYGLSVAAIGATLLIYYNDKSTTVTILACLIMMIYGIRLAGFLVYRELKNGAYKKRKTSSEDFSLV